MRTTKMSPEKILGGTVLLLLVAFGLSRSGPTLLLWLREALSVHRTVVSHSPNPASHPSTSAEPVALQSATASDGYVSVDVQRELLTAHGEFVAARIALDKEIASGTFKLGGNVKTSSAYLERVSTLNRLSTLHWPADTPAGRAKQDLETLIRFSLGVIEEYVRTGDRANLSLNSKGISVRLHRIKADIDRL